MGVRKGKRDRREGGRERQDKERGMGRKEVDSDREGTEMERREKGEGGSEGVIRRKRGEGETGGKVNHLTFSKWLISKLISHLATKANT